MRKRNIYYYLHNTFGSVFEVFCLGFSSIIDVWSCIKKFLVFRTHICRPKYLTFHPGTPRTCASRTHVCEHRHACTRAGIQTCTQVDGNAGTHTQTRTFTHVCSRVHTRTQVQTLKSHTQTYTNAHIHVYKLTHTGKQAHTYADIQSDTNIHTNTRTHTHTKARETAKTHPTHTNSRSHTDDPTLIWILM